MLDEDAVLQHRQLRVLVGLTDDHLAVHRFAASQEFGVGDDRAASATGGTPLTTTLLLGLHTSRALDAGDLVSHRLTRARLTNLDDDLAGIVVRTADVLTTAAATTATTTGGIRIPGLRAILRAVPRVVIVVRLALRSVVLGVLAAPTTTSTPTTATTVLAFLLGGGVLGLGGRLLLDGISSLLVRLLVLLARALSVLGLALALLRLELGHLLGLLGGLLSVIASLGRTSGATATLLRHRGLSPSDLDGQGVEDVAGRALLTVLEPEGIGQGSLNLVITGLGLGLGQRGIDGIVVRSLVLGTLVILGIRDGRLALGIFLGLVRSPGGTTASGATTLGGSTLGLDGRSGLRCATTGGAGLGILVCPSGGLGVVNLGRGLVLGGRAGAPGPRPGRVGSGVAIAAGTGATRLLGPGRHLLGHRVLGLRLGGLGVLSLRGLGLPGFLDLEGLSLGGLATASHRRARKVGCLGVGGDDGAAGTGSGDRYRGARGLALGRSPGRTRCGPTASRSGNLSGGILVRIQCGVVSLVEHCALLGLSARSVPTRVRPCENPSADVCKRLALY